MSQTVFPAIVRSTSRQVASLYGRVALCLHDREIWRAMQSFRSGGAPQRGLLQYRRTKDLLNLLDRHRPRSICEFGSGLSTAIFARYAAASGASLVSFEQSPEWARLTADALKQLGLESFAPHVVNTTQDAEGRWYEKSPPSDADFFYVDGPAPKTKADKHLPCLDCVRAMDRGHSPAVIVFDGRLSSVKAARESQPGLNYVWSTSDHHTVALKRVVPFNRSG